MTESFIQSDRNNAHSPSTTDLHSAALRVTTARAILTCRAGGWAAHLVRHGAAERYNHESMKTFRNLKFLAAALAFVVGIGTAGFHYIEGWPWFDGFYMVIITLTTIGYQEVHPLSHAGRVFNVFVILSGVSLLLLGVGALSQALLEFELQSFFGRRRMEREIGRLDDHYIICGMGRVGRSVARELARKPAPFVIIDNADAKLQRFTSENWLVMHADATQEQTLRE